MVKVMSKERLSKEREQQIRDWNGYWQKDTVFVPNPIAVGLKNDGVELLGEIDALRDDAKKKHRKGAFGACRTCGSDPWWWRFDEFKVGDEVWIIINFWGETRQRARCVAPIPDEPGMWITKLEDGSHVRTHMLDMRHLKHPSMNPYLWSPVERFIVLKKQADQLCIHCGLEPRDHRPGDLCCLRAVHLVEQEDGTWIEDRFAWYLTWFEPDKELYAQRHLDEFRSSR